MVSNLTKSLNKKLNRTDKKTIDDFTKIDVEKYKNSYTYQP